MPYTAIPTYLLSPLSLPHYPRPPLPLFSPSSSIFSLFSLPFALIMKANLIKHHKKKSQRLAYTCSFCNFFLFLPFSITSLTSVVRFAGRSPSAIHCQRPTYPSFPFSISSTFPTFSLFLSHFLTTQTQLFMLKHSYTFYVDFFYLCIFEFIFFLIKVSAVMTL